MADACSSTHRRERGRDFASTPTVAVLLVAALIVGCGTEKETTPSVNVPNVTGAPVAQAEARLERSGLHWRFDGTDDVHAAAAGQAVSFSRVLKQVPSAGTRVAPGTVIVLSTTCTVPEPPPECNR